MHIDRREQVAEKTAISSGPIYCCLSYVVYVCPLLHKVGFVY